jgi:hypothetical protein
MHLLQASLNVLRRSLVVLRLSRFGFGPRMTTLGRRKTMLRASMFVLAPTNVVLGRNMYLLGRRNIVLGPNPHRSSTGIAIFDPLRREIDASGEENDPNRAASGSPGLLHRPVGLGGPGMRRSRHAAPRTRERKEFPPMEA